MCLGQCSTTVKRQYEHSTADNGRHLTGLPYHFRCLDYQHHAGEQGGMQADMAAQSSTAHQKQQGEKAIGPGWGF